MIMCCFGCVAPKRHPGCHGHCPEYAKDKAAHDEQKAAEDTAKAISYGINAQKAEYVRKAFKRMRCRKC